MRHPLVRTEIGGTVVWACKDRCCCTTVNPAKRRPVEETKPL